MERWQLTQLTGKIITCGDKQGGCTPIEFSRRVLNSPQWRNLRHLLNVSEDVAKEPVVKAEIWQGGWVTPCPFCQGIEDGDPASPYFLCCSCWNTNAGGKILPVEYPKNRERIEALLLQRPDGKQRNWSAVETIKDIKQQNQELRSGVR